MPSEHPPILLFDLDGTLIDTGQDLVATLNTMLTRRGRPAAKMSDAAQLIGNGAMALIERGFGDTGGIDEDRDALLDEFIAHYSKSYDEHSVPYPGVVETLERLAGDGHRMAVCTNKMQKLSDPILESLNLMKFFDAVAGGDRFDVRKPDGGHLLQTLEVIGAGGSPAVMVGDSINDVNAARNADMPIIVVSYGYTETPPAELGGDALIDNFTEIPALLPTLSGRQ